MDWKRNGKGVSIYTTGEKYDGNFKNDLRDGQGILTGPDGLDTKEIGRLAK